MFFLLAFATSLWSQTNKKQLIIIDTDAATDDFKAIVQLLAINEMSCPEISLHK